ncbi:hypothetical protein, conserved [Plasmodium gonderi]|uniref:Uncharacterized protein n=1 Tax=Plasmodium gonderi TaxID=77519 RepID=A0A1Y1JID8_PLAGO|nr:hypothetical protein, conserved [Plasmodium gonderi]GAW80572.1 hypothetical protein, conserved [Plasmodium gonderi]
MFFSMNNEENQNDTTKCKLTEEGETNTFFEVPNRDMKGVLNDHMVRENNNITEKETVIKKKNEHAINPSSVQNLKKENVESPIQYTISVLDEIVSKTSEYSKLFLNHFNENESQLTKTGISANLVLDRTIKDYMESKENYHPDHKDLDNLQKCEKENVMNNFNRTMFIREYNENDTKKECYLNNYKDEDVYNDLNKVYSCYSNFSFDNLNNMDNITASKSEAKLFQSDGVVNKSIGRNECIKLLHMGNNEEDIIKENKTGSGKNEIRDMLSTCNTEKSNSYDESQKYSDQEMSEDCMKRTHSDDAIDEDIVEVYSKKGKEEFKMSNKMEKPALSNKSLEELNYSNRKSHSPSFIEKENLLDISSIADQARKRVCAELGYDLNDIGNFNLLTNERKSDEIFQEVDTLDTKKSTVESESDAKDPDETFDSLHLDSKAEKKSSNSNESERSNEGSRNSSDEIEKIFSKYQIEVSHVSKYFDFNKNEKKENIEAEKDLEKEYGDEHIEKKEQIFVYGENEEVVNQNGDNVERIGSTDVRFIMDEKYGNENGSGLNGRDLNGSGLSQFNEESLKKRPSMNYLSEEESINLDVYETNYLTEDVLKGVLNVKEEKITFEIFKNIYSDVNYDINLSNVELLFNAIEQNSTQKVKNEHTTDLLNGNKMEEGEKYVTVNDIKSYIIERNTQNNNYFNEIIKMIVHFNNILLLMMNNNETEVKDKILFELLSLKFLSIFNDILHVQNNFDNLIKHINEIIKLIISHESKEQGLKEIISGYLISQKIRVHENNILSQLSLTNHIHNPQLNKQLDIKQDKESCNILDKGMSKDVDSEIGLEDVELAKQETKLDLSPTTDTYKKAKNENDPVQTKTLNTNCVTRNGKRESIVDTEKEDKKLIMKLIEAENNTRNLTKDIIMDEIKNTDESTVKDDLKSNSSHANRKEKGSCNPFLNNLNSSNDAMVSSNNNLSSSSEVLNGSNDLSSIDGMNKIDSVEGYENGIIRNNKKHITCKNNKMKDLIIKKINKKSNVVDELKTKQIPINEEENEKNKKIKKVKKVNREKTSQRSFIALTEVKKKMELTKNAKNRKTVDNQKKGEGNQKIIDHKEALDIKKVENCKKIENYLKNVQENKEKSKMLPNNNLSEKKDELSHKKNNKIEVFTNQNFNFSKFSQNRNTHVISNNMMSCISTSDRNVPTISATAAAMEGDLEKGIEKNKYSPQNNFLQENGHSRIFFQNNPSMSNTYMNGIQMNRNQMGGMQLSNIHGKINFVNSPISCEIKSKERASIANLSSYKDICNKQIGKNIINGTNPMQQKILENSLWKDDSGKGDIVKNYRATTENESHDHIYNYSSKLEYHKKKQVNMSNKIQEIANISPNENQGSKMKQNSRSTTDKDSMTKKDSNNLTLEKLTKGNIELWGQITTKGEKLGQYKSQWKILKDENLLDKEKTNLDEKAKKKGIQQNDKDIVVTSQETKKNQLEEEKGKGSKNEPFMNQKMNHTKLMDNNLTNEHTKDSTSVSNINHFNKQPPFVNKRYSSEYNKMINQKMYTGFKRNVNHFNDMNNVLLHAKGLTYSNRHFTTTNNDNLFGIRKEGEKKDNVVCTNPTNLESNVSKLSNLKKFTDLKKLMHLANGLNEGKNSQGNIETEKNTIENKSAYNRFTEIFTNKIKNFTLRNSKSIRCSKTHENVPFSNDTNSEEKDKSSELKMESKNSDDNSSKVLEENTSKYHNSLVNEKGNYLCDNKKRGNIVDSFIEQLNFFQSKCTSVEVNQHHHEESLPSEDNKTQMEVAEAGVDTREDAREDAGGHTHINDTTKKPTEHKNIAEDKNNDIGISQVSSIFCTVKNNRDDVKKRGKGMHIRKPGILGVSNGKDEDIQQSGNVNNYPNGHMSNSPIGHTNNYPIGYMNNYPIGHMQNSPIGHMKALNTHTGAMRNLNNAMYSGKGGINWCNEFANNMVHKSNNASLARNRNIIMLEGMYKPNYNSQMQNRINIQARGVPRGASAAPVSRGSHNMKKTNSYFLHHNQHNGELFFPFQKRNSTLHNPVSVPKFQGHQNKMTDLIEKEKNLLDICDMNAKNDISYSNEINPLFKTEHMQQTMHNYRKKNVSNDIGNIEQYTTDKRTFVNPFMEQENSHKGLGYMHLSNNILLNKSNANNRYNYSLFNKKINFQEEKNNTHTSTFNSYNTKDQLKRNCVLKDAHMQENYIMKPVHHNWNGTAHQIGTQLDPPNVDKCMLQKWKKNNANEVDDSSKVYHEMDSNKVYHENVSNLWNPQNFTKETTTLKKNDGRVSMAPNFLTPYHKDIPSNDMQSVNFADESNNLTIEQIMKIPGVKLGKNYIQDVDICSDWLKFNDYDKKVIEESLKNSFKNKNYKNFMDSMQSANGFYSTVK